MLDINRHKFLLVQVLKEIYADIELANHLGFKGGTALMLLHGLPRFSVDLDFNLLGERKSKEVFDKIITLLVKHGQIKDKAQKHFGLLVVLDYGAGERNLKVEISNRRFNDHYETKNFLGINLNVMTLTDMFSHKLCALLDRNMLTGRDLFDCWFLMEKKTPVNKSIIETRTGLLFERYLEKCIEKISSLKPAAIMSGLGELLDEGLKPFVRNQLLDETLQLFRLYKAFPFGPE